MITPHDGGTALYRERGESVSESYRLGSVWPRFSCGFGVLSTVAYMMQCVITF